MLFLARVHASKFAFVPRRLPAYEINGEFEKTGIHNDELHRMSLVLPRRKKCIYCKAFYVRVPKISFTSSGLPVIHIDDKEQRQEDSISSVLKELQQQHQPCSGFGIGVIASVVLCVLCLAGKGKKCKWALLTSNIWSAIIMVSQVRPKDICGSIAL